MTYSDKLPRRRAPRGHKCQVLHSSGERCKQPALWEVSAHLESELYQEVTWIVLHLCKEHWIVEQNLWGECKK